MTLYSTIPPEELNARNMRYHSWFIAGLDNGLFCLYDGRRRIHTIGTAEEVFAQFSCIPHEAVKRERVAVPPPTVKIDLSEIDIDLDF